MQPRDEAAILAEIGRGDLSRFDRIGWQMDGGQLLVDGGAGHYAGGGMRGGEMQVRGDAGLLAACEMAGGLLQVDGDVDDFAAAPLPGSMDGMRGGTLIVRGRAGARCRDRGRGVCERACAGPRKAPPRFSPGRAGARSVDRKDAPIARST